MNNFGDNDVMTFSFSINTELFVSPFFWGTLYAVGLIVAANIAAVKYRRRAAKDDYIFRVDYLAAAIFWPVLMAGLLVFAAVNVFLLPSRFFK